ncbi:amidohydrolase [Peribacillus kribbensis]|uniref:amidohydrolase n=1 Tax=Peribacillus kribbensis TaxID=356658 RepID=UPI0003FD3F8F|nr:amidohydrolase [Peribacillus kribbensis]
MDPLSFIDKSVKQIYKTYEELHRLAEPSWQEKQTSAYIANELRNAGIAFKTFDSHYGIAAEIPGTMKEAVILRADLDALVQEVDGRVRPNHSCGHDAHSTMVLYTALAIAKSGVKPRHTLRFIFQPAEEKGEGALKMMSEGVLKDAEYLFGLHLRPSFEVPFNQASPVIIHSSSGTIKGRIKGRQAHAARPDDGINAIEAAALLVHKLKQVTIDTKASYSIKMTQLQTSNNASNVIPETADFSLDARAQENRVMTELKRLAHLVMDEVSAETGTEISCTLEEFVPAAQPNKDAMKIAETAIKDVLGEENFLPVCISPGGEDFHFYTLENPGINATMVGLGCGLAPGLHHPKMSFRKEALIYGCKILIKTVLLASEKE